MVAIKAGILNFCVNRVFKRPIITEKINMTKIPTNTAAFTGMGSLLQQRPTTMPVRATVEGTERSISPQDMANVIPYANTPIWAMFRKIPEMFFQDINPLVVIPRMMINITIEISNIHLMIKSLDLTLFADVSLI
jgi:hypothetical protein